MNPRNDQIICAGYGRTGTTSLEHALERLGFIPVYSFFNIVKRRDLFREWIVVFKHSNPRPCLCRHVSSFKVVSDFPICIYADYLLAQSPGAKVILSVRDEDEWARSMVNLYKFAHGVEITVGTALSDRVRQVSDLFNRHVWTAVFKDGEPGDPDTAVRNYRRHNDKIRSIVKADNLLEFNVKQGWPPLCTFLGIDDVPNQAFPHVNRGLNHIRMSLLNLAFGRFEKGQ